MWPMRGSWLAAAASLLIVLTSGGWWTTWRDLDDARHRLADFESSRQGLVTGLVEVPVVDLFPGGLRLRGANGDHDAVVIESRASVATLILNTELETREEDLRLQLRDGSGGTLMEMGGLTIEPLHSLTLSLPVAGLDPGEYELALLAPSDEATSPEEPLVLETYLLRIE
jgi:hypothetical protein